MYDVSCERNNHFSKIVISIYTVAFNESFFLPYFIKHYRKNFPDSRIVIYDNQSTDDTVSIAKRHGCEVISYDTGGKLSDATYLQIKNNCWKDADTSWVLVCDVDELLDINQVDLENEDEEGVTIIRSEGFNMVNLKDNLKVNTITHAVRSESYDKTFCFDKKYIKDIHYNMGCHKAYPDGFVKESEKAYRCRHYKYIEPSYMVRRHAMYAARLSEENLKGDHGGHYRYPEERIREEFENARKQAIKIL